MVPVSSVLLEDQHQTSERTYRNIKLAAAAGVAGVSAFVANSCACEKAKEDSNVTPSAVQKEDFQKVQDSHDIESMPIYTAAQVAQHDGSGKDGSVWMSYGGVVYGKKGKD